LTSMLQQIQSFDTRTFLALSRHPRRHLLSRISLLLSATADGWFYLLLIPLAMLAKPETARHILKLVLIAFVIERTCYFVLKNTLRRQRPQQALAGFTACIIPADKFSLPSGHTSAAFLVVTLLCLTISPLFMPLYLWAAGVGFSRVMLGVHYPSDIVSGALLGSSIAINVV
jgi:undecaprenyl-diphosphatase